LGSSLNRPSNCSRSSRSRQPVELNYRPMPKVDSRVSEAGACAVLPSRWPIIRPRPNRPPSRCTAECAFCAASVASVASGGLRQRSHWPQASTVVSPHCRKHQALGRQVEQIQRPLVACAARCRYAPPGQHSSRASRPPPPTAARPTPGRHQGNQGGDDQPKARPDQRWDPVAQAFAGASRQDGERAASDQNLADKPGLQTAEVGVAEGVVQSRAASSASGCTHGNEESVAMATYSAHAGAATG
jgi:hypothetical protein